MKCLEASIGSLEVIIDILQNIKEDRTITTMAQDIKMIESYLEMIKLMKGIK